MSSLRIAPLLLTTVLALILIGAFVAVGYAVTPPVVAAMASSLGFEQLIVTGPHDMTVAGLKVGLALASAPAAAWLATVVTLVRGHPRWVLSFVVAGALVLTAATAGMVARLVWVHWQVQEAAGSSGLEIGLPATSFAPGGWGLIFGIVAAALVVAYAALRPSRAP